MSSNAAGRRLISGIVVLVVVMVAAFLLASPVAFFTAGSFGLIACGVAASICMAAGIGGFFASRAFCLEVDVLCGMLVGMGVRMFLPLASVSLVFVHRPFLDAGMIYYLLVFYIVMLIADIAVILPVVGTSQNSRRLNSQRSTR